MDWIDPPCPEGVPEPFTSNQHARDAFLSYKKSDGAPNTAQNCTYAVNAYLEWLGDLPVTAVRPGQARQYIDGYATKCSRFLRNRGAWGDSTCKVGQDLTLCPMLTAASGTHACPRYQAIKETTVDVHVRHVKSFYDWLQGREYIEANPFTVPHREWHRRKRNIINATRAKPGKAEATREDAYRIYQRSSWRWGPIFVTMAKTGARPHEIPQLNYDATEFHEQRILRIPGDPQYGNKRLGNMPLQVDDELYRVLCGYLRHRDRFAKPKETSFFISQHGLAYTPANWATAFRRANRNSLQKAELGHTGITPHSARGLYTQALVDNGCPDGWRAILRGSPLPGSEPAYHRPHLAAEMNQRYGPKLGIAPADIV